MKGNSVSKPTLLAINNYNYLRGGAEYLFLAQYL